MIITDEYKPGEWYAFFSTEEWHSLQQDGSLILEGNGSGIVTLPFGAFPALPRDYLEVTVLRDPQLP